LLAKSVSIANVLFGSFNPFLRGVAMIMKLSDVPNLVNILGQEARIKVGKNLLCSVQGEISMFGLCDGNVRIELDPENTMYLYRDDYGQSRRIALDDRSKLLHHTFSVETQVDIGPQVVVIMDDTHASGGHIYISLPAA